MIINRQGEAWHKLRIALTPELSSASTVFGFFPALNQVSDDFINLIRDRRIGNDVKGFEDLAYKMGLESECFYHASIQTDLFFFFIHASSFLFFVPTAFGIICPKLCGLLLPVSIYLIFLQNLFRHMHSDIGQTSGLP